MLMKRFYFFVICALISVQTFAQDKWADIWCNTWNVLYHGWDPEGGDDPYMPYTFIYQLEEDTTINDLTYQRLTGRFSLSTTHSECVVSLYRFSNERAIQETANH